MTNKNMECYRQGDICFEKIREDEIPGEYKKIDEILKVEGEHGNTHLMEGVQVFTLAAQQSLLPAMVRVPKKGADMEHEEHDTLSLPVGIYLVTQFKEYDNPNPID